MDGKKIEHKRHADLNNVMSDCANNPMVAQASNTMMDYFVHVSKLITALPSAGLSINTLRPMKCTLWL